MNPVEWLIYASALKVIERWCFWPKYFPSDQIDSAIAIKDAVEKRIAGES